MALIDSPEKASRRARVIAQDISIYNEAKIVRGLQEDNFFELLANELQEGLDHYKSCVSPELHESGNHFWRAIIDVIIFRKSHVKSKIW